VRWWRRTRNSFFAENLQKRGKKFGSYQINAYLCTVRMHVLATPLSAGSKTLSPLLHFKSHLKGRLFLFLVEFSKDAIEFWVCCQSSLYGDSLASFEDKYFNSIMIRFEVCLDI